MSLQRAASGNVVATARQYAARQHTGDASAVVTSHRREGTMSHSEEHTGRDIAPRLPSTRPIDHRWDRSRGIVSSNAKRASTTDFTWSRDRGVVFLGRTYASRQLNSGQRGPPPVLEKSRPPPVSEAPRSQPVSAKNGSLVDNPNRMPAYQNSVNARRVDQLEADLADSRKENKDKDGLLAEMEAEIRKLRDDMGKQKKAQAQQEKTEALEQRAKALEQENQAHEQRAKESEQRFQAQERLHQGVVQRWTVRVDERDQKIQQAAEDFQKQLADTEEKVRTEERERYEEQVRQQPRKDDEQLAVEVQRGRELAREINQHDHKEHTKDRELKALRIALKQAIDQGRDAEDQRRARKTADRSNYVAFRELFDDFGTAMADFFRHINYHVEGTLLEHDQFLASQPSYLDGMARLESTFEEMYPVVVDRLKQWIREHRAVSTRLSESIGEYNSRLLSVFQDFKEKAHHSRTLTNFHHYDRRFTRPDTIKLYHQFYHEPPARQRREDTMPHMKQLEQQLNDMVSDVDKASIEQKKLMLEQSLPVVTRVIRILVALRNSAELKALLKDSKAEKEIFVVMQAIDKLALETNVRWRHLVGDTADNNEPSKDSRRILKTYRSAFREGLHEAQKIREDLKLVVIKRAMLEESLGLLDEKEPELDKTIRSALAEDNVDLDTTLKVLKVSRPGRRRGTVSFPSSRASTSSPTTTGTKRPARPALRKDNVSSGAGTTITVTNAAQQIAGIKRQLDDLAGSHEPDAEAERQRLKSDMRALSVKRRHAAANLSRGKRRAAASMYGPESIQVQKYNHALRRVEATGPRLANLTPTVVKSAPHRVYWPFHQSTSAVDDTMRYDEVGTADASGSSPKPSDVSKSSSPEAERDQSEAQLESESGAQFDYPTLDRDAPVSTARAHSTSHALVDDGTSERVEPEAVTSSDVSVASEDASLAPGQPDFAPPSAYNISPQDRRIAALTSRSSDAAYWSYKLYKDKNGQHPTLHYCTTAKRGEEVLQDLLKEKVLGFDMEWEPSAKSTSGIKRNVCLIQVASEAKIVLLQISLFTGDTADELVPPTLRAILESEDIVKTGVNISGDARRVREYLGVDLKGLFELSHLYRVVRAAEGHPHNVNRKLVKLADQVQSVLLLPLKKSEVRVSAWSKRLNIQQTDYAGSDAYAGFCLFHALEARRKALRPTPPRPAYFERLEPLVFADGRRVPATVARKPKSAVATAAADNPVAVDEAAAGQSATMDEQAEEATVVDEDAGEIAVVDEDAEEDFYDAAEYVDAIGPESSIEVAGVPLTGLQVSYPSLPPLDASYEAAEDEAGETIEAEEECSDDDSLSRAQVKLADSWIASWRASLPEGSNLKVGDSTLRAYHLWHEQDLNVPQVAALVRDPPLLEQTIATYILQAIKAHDLPFDEDRLRECFAILPNAVHSRYKKIGESLSQRKD